jgi:hypothetical protein
VVSADVGSFGCPELGFGAGGGQITHLLLDLVRTSGLFAPGAEMRANKLLAFDAFGRHLESVPRGDIRGSVVRWIDRVSPKRAATDLLDDNKTSLKGACLRDSEKPIRRGLLVGSSVVPDSSASNARSSATLRRMALTSEFL